MLPQTTSLATPTALKRACALFLQRAIVLSVTGDSSSQPPEQAPPPADTRTTAGAVAALKARRSPSSRPPRPPVEPSGSRPREDAQSDPDRQSDTTVADKGVISGDAALRESDPTEPALAKNADPGSRDASRKVLTGRAVPLSGRSGPKNLPMVAQYGKYELVGRLAVGGMAEIFLAREPSKLAGDRYVVIKRVLAHVADDQKFVDMFFDEARLVTQLNHPNICHVYEFGEEQGSYYLSMEWVDGMNLSRFIRKARELESSSIAVGVKIISLVADALHYVHRARDSDGEPFDLVHRDVSPQNIMVSYGGNIKLVDFGIAKARVQHNKTSEGQLKGKFAYMSPEQCQGHDVDARSDIFSLGICLYEILTGVALYHRTTHFETMRAIIEEPPPDAQKFRPDLPDTLGEIIKKALAKNVDDRYQTAGEMQHALEKWLADAGDVVSSDDIAQEMRRAFPDAVAGSPEVDTSAFDSHVTLLGVRRARKRRKLLAGLLLAASLCVLGAAGIHAYGAWRDKSDWAQREVGTQAAADNEGSLFIWSGAVDADRQNREQRIALSLDGHRFEGKLPFRLDDVPTGAHMLRVEHAGGVLNDAVEVVAGGVTPVPLSGASDQVLTEGQATGVEPKSEASFNKTPSYDSNAEKEKRKRERALARAAQKTGGDAPAGTARLSINTTPWSTVFINGKKVGTTPLGNLRVPAGKVKLRLESRDGKVYRKRLQLKKGSKKRISHTF